MKADTDAIQNNTTAILEEDKLPQTGIRVEGGSAGKGVVGRGAAAREAWRGGVMSPASYKWCSAAGRQTTECHSVHAQRSSAQLPTGECACSLSGVESKLSPESALHLDRCLGAAPAAATAEGVSRQ